MPSRSSFLASPTLTAASSPLAVDELDGPSRRLLKARHHDMDKMEIQTNTLTAVLHYETIKFTIYKLQIRSTARFADGGEWTLIKRYSEFFYFRQTLLKLLEKWDLHFRNDTERLQCKEFTLATALLLPSLEIPTFPRKHMRCDTVAIIKERRAKLQQFVRKMLDAYTDISVFLHDTQSRNTRAFSNLSDILQVLEEFMVIPPQQKEINRRQTAAVLALEDVENATSDCKDRTCCICLNDYDSDVEEEEIIEDTMVKLPCSHQFHEDCVIDWFNTSTTCPLCRKPAFTEEHWSFDVSIN
ncbi:hypothetical protein F441_20321 [Phytophthora nicotianae CJ01A1]|uniref:RING-type domain-containing protein n=6 Tax=Phytophthora nicotianae TaxID=4792 RepID=W2QUF6_PHYN3|nr:hypothetical protein PPTG_05773 [Phytophthora nicotianae INRA-310]ETI32795.1 hypothetical protein F443_20445 [Phytophthora nicotianae P1569]ETK73142.1 hypothetical protein L915_19884 [Phytophthora nicotianae]ETO61553.1 hypothetical protein F444_20456 [Phytophthora nicotianae P1976]ETP02619.1 hypothetical protein F441_20321 [Phytophthora nicotianae CJ01A1]ETP30801.1 hypothetical protein F442_20258 [Phytophthora nicotianae P10297]KUF74990.1 E3 ubiquitin-protein ligase [Phytophthora nicotiana